MQMLWAVVGLNTSNPNVIQVRASHFEEDYYVEPGQHPLVSGMVPRKLLFESKCDAIQETLNSLRKQAAILKAQIEHLEDVRCNFS